MTGMQDPCVEKIREFWQEIQPVVSHENCPDDLFLATVCCYVYRALHYLMQGNLQKSKEELWNIHYLFVTSRTASEEPELLRQALYIFDIGQFAWNLASYSRYGWAWAGGARCYCDILHPAREIWRSREVFAPHLTDALHAAYVFMTDLKYVKPWRAFRYALKSTSYICNFRHCPAIYEDRPIGHVLGSSAIAKLKEILRAYVRKRNSGGGE